MYQATQWWDNIPHAMRDHAHFMCATDKKIPFNPYTGSFGKDDPANWMTYGDACYWAETQTLVIGFVPRPDDPFVIIDLDNKPESNISAEDAALRDQLLAWAIENTYVEKSSSGNGYHVVITGALPADINRGTKRGVEAYANKGFVILTGNIISKTREIAHSPSTCEWLYTTYAEGTATDRSEGNDFYSLNQEQINNPPQWELDEDQKFLDSIKGWKNENKIRSWFYAEDTDSTGVGGSVGDLQLVQLFVEFTRKRKYPDESAMRMFLRSPRGRKLGRKNGSWPKYCMTTLLAAKNMVASGKEKQTGLAEGVNNMLAEFEAKRLQHAELHTANTLNRAAGIPMPQVPNMPPVVYKHKFDFLKPSDILSESPLEWALENVFQMRSVNAIYGWSGVGKSFVAIDLMFAFAEGREWFGHETQQLNVTYLALEGGDGLRNRLHAYMHGSKKHSLPDSIDIYRGKFNLRSKEMIGEFIDQRKQAEAFGGVIFIDTFAKAIPGADENSANDMGDAVVAAELMKDQLGACVIIVHHSTKPDKVTGIAGGLRGSGAIQAGIDGVMQVAKREEWDEKNGTLISRTRFIVMDKVKDGEDGTHYPFDLPKVKIGERTRKSGEIVDVFSCHVVNLRDQVNSRIAPVASNNVPTYSEAEHAGTAATRVPKAPRSGAKSQSAANEQHANSYEWAQLIQTALTLDAQRTHFANKGKFGAPPDKTATPRSALVNLVWEIANPPELTRELKKALMNTLDYQYKSGKIGRAMNDGTQYFWQS
jgi:hypothetical protein